MDANPSHADDQLAVLAEVVGTQRTVLEEFAFKLVALRLVLSADLRRYVARCLDEIEAVAEQLQRIEERRAAALAAVAAVWDRVPSSLPLAELVEQAPEPWASVFADHLDGLRALVLDIEATAGENARLCRATLAAVAEDLAVVDTDPGRSRAPRPDAGPPLRLVSPGGAARRPST